jgi:hypothetical protein
MAMERGGDLPRSPPKKSGDSISKPGLLWRFSIFRGKKDEVGRQKNQLTTVISRTWWASGSYCQRSAWAKLGSAAETWLVVSNI